MNQRQRTGKAVKDSFPGLHWRIKEWRSGGILADREYSVRDLVDVGLARVEFLAALGELPAWRDFADLYQGVVKAGLHVTDDGDGLLSPSLQATVDIWVRRHSIDVPWVREWVTRTINSMPDVVGGYVVDGYKVKFDDTDIVLTKMISDHWDMREVLGRDEDALPSPNPYDVIEACGRGEDLTPYPGLETLEAWLERARDAYLERAADLQLLTMRKSIRNPTRDARWFARFQVAGESYESILPDANVDRRTLERQVSAFAELIGIPKRTVA